MGRESQGICPRCRINTGTVGQACPNPDCRDHGYNYIPFLSFDAASAQAEKKGSKIEPWLGRRLDRYLLTGKAGEGGMGTVFIALQEPLNREVAVKVMTAISNSREALDRFETEAKALSALDHPNILKLFDYGFGNVDEQTVPYMVLEFVKHGRTLKKAIGQDILAYGAMKPENISQIFSQVLTGLGAAHAAGIIHRDVKPENVMLTQIHGNTNFAKILDFGLATGLNGAGPGQTGLNQILGTPNYMAPEQIPSGKRVEVDHRADLYAVGVILFEAMTGVRPFPGDTVLAVLTSKANEKYNPFDIPNVSKLTRMQRAFLEKAIAFNRDDRFQDAKSMLDALEAAIADQSQKRKPGLFSFVDRRISSSQPAISLPDTFGSAPTPTPTPSTMPMTSVRRNTPIANPFPMTRTNGMSKSGLDIEIRPRTPTGPIAASTVPVRTMTPEERAERLKNRRRRTTGRDMVAARLSAAEQGSRNVSVHATEDHKGLLLGGLLISLVLITGLAFAVPHFQKVSKFNRLKADLRELSEPLTTDGRFAGLDSLYLLPGTQLDHFVSDPLKSGQPAKDPWGNPYRVKYSLENPAGYILYSTGPDGERDNCGRDPGTDDVCVSLGKP